VNAQESLRGDPAGPPPPAKPSADPAKNLKKGLMRAQVEDLFGPPATTRDRTQNGLTITSCSYQTAT